MQNIRDQYDDLQITRNTIHCRLVDFQLIQSNFFVLFVRSIHGLIIINIF